MLENKFVFIPFYFNLIKRCFLWNSPLHGLLIARHCWHYLVLNKHRVRWNPAALALSDAQGVIVSRSRMPVW